MNSAYFYSVFSRGRLDTWWQRWWFLFCLLFQRWATRNLPLEPPRLFLYTQRLRTKLEISIARRYLKWNRHLHSIFLTARRKGGSTTVCIIPKSHTSDSPTKPSNISLEMWNKVKMKGLGTCKLLVENPKTLMKYMVKFIVVDEQLIPPA